MNRRLKHRPCWPKKGVCRLRPVKRVTCCKPYTLGNASGDEARVAIASGATYVMSGPSRRSDRMVLIPCLCVRVVRT